jgi:hypothetical protein
MRADVQEPNQRHTVPDEREMIATSISIKGTRCKSGGCMWKAVELSSGDLSFVRESGLRVE